MKWVQRTSIVGKWPYTALVTNDEKREIGRYWHKAHGFVPDSSKNNAKPRPTHDEAREVVLRGVLDRYKIDMRELGRELFAVQEARRANVPRRTPVEQSAPTEFQVTEENQEGK